MVDWNERLERAEAALRINAADRDAARSRVQARVALDLEDNPIVAMTAHLEQFPDDAHGWNLLSAYHLFAGGADDAARASDRAIELEPADAIFSYNRACARAQLGDIDGALEDLARAVECDEDLRGFALQDESFVALRGDARFRTMTRTL